MLRLCMICPSCLQPLRELQWDCFAGKARMEDAVKLVRHNGREAVKFKTASGVTAVVATCVSPVLMNALKRKLQRKLRRSGLLPGRDF